MLDNLAYGRVAEWDGRCSAWPGSCNIVTSCCFSNVHAPRFEAAQLSRAAGTPKPALVPSSSAMAPVSTANVALVSTVSHNYIGP